MGVSVKLASLGAAIVLMVGLVGLFAVGCPAATWTLRAITAYQFWNRKSCFEDA
jgi:hypothetical protein